MPIFSVSIKINLPKIIYIHRYMIKEYCSLRISLNFCLKNLLPLKGPKYANIFFNPIN